MMENHSLQKLWPLAYSIFGLVLGTLGPVTYFLVNVAMSELVKMSQGLNTGRNVKDILVFSGVITGICAFAGLVTGLIIGLIQMFLWRKPWVIPLALAPVLGLIWAVVTGGAGTVWLLIIGAVIGAAFAIPYGVAGFTIFAAVFEPRARRIAWRWWQVALLAIAIALPLSLIVSLLINLLLYGRQLQGR